MRVFKEFKEFAMRGNVVDMAVGIVIGSAFGRIVSSLVSDVVMPPIGKLIGGVNFSELRVSLGETTERVTKDGETTEVVKEAFIQYGSFLQTVFDFLIVAAAIFLVVKAMNRATTLSQRDEEIAAAPTERDCPFCVTKISVQATRCPHCTSPVEAVEGVA